jgi:serine/threonine protein kinase
LDSDDAPDIAPPLAGGRYRLTAIAGEGGMGHVYVAFDTRMRARRAAKVLRPRLASRAGARDRFLREGRLMAMFEHPNVVRVLDVGEDADRLYLIMEYVGGGTAADLMRRPPPPAEAARLIVGVLDALAALHERGIVHRDVKPANVLIDESGRPRLTDFGVAQFADDASQTMTSERLGSFAYASPEQLLRARGVDHRADVYATGATLAALISGVDPVALRDPSERDPFLATIPSPWRDIVRTATSHRPDERYPDARSMQRLVERSVSGPAVDVVAPPAAPPFRASGGRGWIAGAAVVALVAFAASLTFVQARTATPTTSPDGSEGVSPPERLAEPAPPPPPTPEVEVEVAVAASPPPPPAPPPEPARRPAPPAAPLAPPDPAPVELGRLVVRSLPCSGAKVAVDGSPPVPCGSSLEVPAGLHSIRFDADGFEPGAMQIEVAPNRKTVVCWDLAEARPCPL